MRPTVVMIVGLPATGKSSLRADLADALTLPAISRDTSQELILDHLPTVDRDGSKRVGIASWNSLYYVIGQMFASGRPFIVDHYFHQACDAAPYEALCDRFRARVIEVACSAAPEVIIARFQRRWETGERHPGHADQGHLDTRPERLLPRDAGQP